MLISVTPPPQMPATLQSQAACGMRAGVFVHGARDGQEVALTFDACPTRQVPGFGAEIVAYLMREALPLVSILHTAMRCQCQPQQPDTARPTDAATQYVLLA